MPLKSESGHVTLFLKSEICMSHKIKTKVKKQQQQKTLHNLSLLTRSSPPLLSHLTPGLHGSSQTCQACY